jgi:DNA polymerase III epsilon subunit-like protein
MTSGSRVTFLDCETAGLEPQHAIIQIAAVVVDVTDGWREIEEYERKIAFDTRKADPEALKLNHWTAEAWKDAPPERIVVEEFGALLKRHSTVTLVSRRTGRPYNVARVGGHNAGGFDLDRVQAMFKRHGAFFPVDFRTVLDTRYGAVWLFEGGAASDPHAAQPKNFKLTGLAEHFGIPTEGAHDALFDVRLSIAIARRLIEGWQRPSAVALRVSAVGEAPHEDRPAL